MGFPKPLTVSGATYDYLGKKQALMARKKFSVEGLARALIRFDNGSTLIVDASWALNIGEPEQMVTILCGTKGGLTQRNTDGSYNFTAEIYTEENVFL